VHPKLWATALAILAPLSMQAATLVDLTSVGSAAIAGGAIYEQGSVGSGTGNYDTFLRIQGSGGATTEKGYNTDGPLEFDTVGGIHTKSLLLSSLSVINLGGIDYYQFGLDINEPGSGSNSLLSLDSLMIYSGAVGNLTGYGTGFTAPSATLVYDLDAGLDRYILLDASLSTGSGTSDMRFFLPTSLFSDPTQPYLYFFSEFGLNSSADGGFEEWGAVTGNAVPEPSTWAMMTTGFGLLAIRILKRKKV
jgi:hypothetical protein